MLLTIVSGVPEDRHLSRSATRRHSFFLGGCDLEEVELQLIVRHSNAPMQSDPAGHCLASPGSGAVSNR